ncbi:MAG: peptide deformylase [Deltaproteobacteria bacterium]|nr:MAG: peptide deformylase [Deltaproteobacteria bacterium]
MAILPILTAPHPVLSAQARKVEDSEFGAELQTLCEDMAETMYDAPGVGLAAPQIGDGRRVIVIDSGETPGSGLLHLCNPEIVERSKETITWAETCLSVPDLEVKVSRHKRVRLTWRSPLGEPKEQVFENFEAVIVQHEIDHLLGTVLLDRVSRFRRSRYLQQLKKRERAAAMA